VGTTDSLDAVVKRKILHFNFRASELASKYQIYLKKEEKGDKILSVLLDISSGTFRIGFRNGVAVFKWLSVSWAH